MAVTINTFPTGIAFSKNNIKLKATTDAYVTTAGVKARWRITFSTDMGVADTLTMTSPIAGTNVLTGSATAGPGLVVPRASETIQDWIDNNFLPVLRAITDIDENYDLYRSGSQAVLEAKEFGTDYNFSAFTASGFTISLTTTSGVTEAVVPDYFMRVRVCMTTTFTSGLFSNNSEWMYYRPNSAGEVEVDIARIVDKLFSEMEEASLVINYGNPSLSVRKMYVQVGDYYETDPTVYDTTVSPIITVVRGGLNYLNPYYSAWTSGTRWLTNRRRFELSVSDFDWLYFLYRKGSYTSLLVRAKVYYTDNTDSTMTCHTDSTSDEYDVIRFSANFTVLGLHTLQPAKTAYKYDLWIQNEADLGYSEVITIDLVSHVPDSRGIFYYNSFGLVENLRCTGVRRSEIEHRRERSMVHMPMGADYNDQPEVDYGIEQRKTLSMSSYPKSELEYYIAAEIYSSKKAWMWWYDGLAFHLTPVNILSGSTDHVWAGKNGEKYRSIDVKVQMPLEETNGRQPWA